MLQKKQSEWKKQWELLQDTEVFLFKDWIYPNTLEDFRDKTVLECGCGGGQHTDFIAPYAKHVTAVDLNTTSVATERNKSHSNIEFVEADIANMDLGRQFDVVFSIGVVHHTDFPDRTLANLERHVKPGGRLIIWVYSEEGNSLVRYGVEPMRKLLLTRVPRRALLALSQMITAMMYIPIHTVYRLPLRRLPFYEYFGNFRKMSFSRNVLNVFDKLNAPQVNFICRDRIERWFQPNFVDAHISAYKRVSWRGTGTKMS